MAHWNVTRLGAQPKAGSVGQVVDLSTISFGRLFWCMYNQDLQNYAVSNLKVRPNVPQHLGVNVGRGGGKVIVCETGVRGGPANLVAPPVFHKINPDAAAVPDDLLSGRRFSKDIYAPMDTSPLRYAQYLGLSLADSRLSC